MKLTADTLTDDHIRDLRDRTLAEADRAAEAGVHVDASRVVALCNEAEAVDPNWPGGQHYWARRHHEARAACVALLNAENCPGRAHRDHAAVTCNGSCCTNCGGPIDENEECRCSEIEAS
jgi:hypothetical protein